MPLRRGAPFSARPRGQVPLFKAQLFVTKGLQGLFRLLCPVQSDTLKVFFRETGVPLGIPRGLLPLGACSSPRGFPSGLEEDENEPFQASPGRVGWTKFVNARPEAGLPTPRCLIEDKRRTLRGHFGRSSEPLRSRVGIRPASQSEPSFIEDKLRHSHTIQDEQGGRPGSATRSRIDSTNECPHDCPSLITPTICKDDSWERDQLVIM